MKRLNGTTYAASGLSDLLNDYGLKSSGGPFQTARDSGSLESVVQIVVNIALPVAGIVALVLLLIAGFKMISSQGNPEKLNDAREIATNAIIGLVFILLSVAILVLLAGVFDIEGIN